MSQLPSEIAVFMMPILLSIVGFFLVQSYNLVKKINEKTTDILIEMGKGEVRISAIEKRIEKLERELEELKKLVHDK